MCVVRIPYCVSPPVREIAITFFYLGHFPKIPGTWGSAGAASCFCAYWLVAGDQPLFDVLLAVGVIAATVVGIALGPWAVRRFERKDPGPFVLDEVAGQWLSLLAIPMVTVERMLVIVAVQFFLFRVFDIVKPTPARQLERLPHGWGIMADDLAVAVYVNLIGQVAFRYLWPAAAVA